MYMITDKSKYGHDAVLDVSCDDKVQVLRTEPMELTAEEQEDALLNAPMVMKFSLKLDSSSYRYVYEFYRCDDRRVMVRIYQSDAQGNMMTTPVSDFYVSTYAFKKIAGGFVSLLNAEEFELNGGYPDFDSDLTQ